MAGPRALLIDLGNRRLKCARDAGGGKHAPPEHFELVAADGSRDLEAAARWLAEKRGAAPAWVCSTHPAALELLRAGPLAGPGVNLVGPGCWPLPVVSQGTGADRVLAAFAAWSRCGGAALVADLGTAWTLDAVSAAGEFLGGAIGAGLGLQEDALARGAPHLDPPARQPGSVIPRGTAEAVAAGTAGALAAALEGLALRFEQHIGSPARRFLTGGDAARLAAWMGPAWERADDLVLEGLARMAARGK